MDKLFPTYTDRFDWNSDGGFDHPDSELYRYVIQQHSHIGPEIHANRFHPGISANYGTISLAGIDNLVERLGTLTEVSRRYECRAIQPFEQRVYRKQGVLNNRGNRWETGTTSAETCNIAGQTVTFNGRFDLFRWAGDSMRFRWKQDPSLNLPVNWRDYVIEFTILRGANSIKITFNGNNIPQVNPEITQRLPTASGPTSWQHFMTIEAVENRMRPQNIARGNWNYIIDIYYRPIVGRFYTERPKLRLNNTTQVLQFPLRGYLFEYLDRPVNIPSTRTGDRHISRRGGSTVYDELRYLVSRLRQGGITVFDGPAAEIQPSDKLRRATGGVVLGSYDTPETYREWLEGLRTIGNMYSIFENRYGEVDFLTTREVATALDTSGFNRRLDGFEILEPPVDNQVAFTGQWNEATAGEFFDTGSNYVFQTDVRFAGQSAGFYRVRGGADQGLPEGEVIT